MSNAAGTVTVVLNANQTQFSAALTEAQRKLDQLAGKSRDAGHSTVSSMQAASASIRLLENPLGSNIRAIERLISQSKLLSGIFKAAFPVVGLISIGVAATKIATEVAAAVDKINQMPNAIRRGFQGLQLSATSSTDALRLTNDELTSSILKLQGKPQNNLAISIDETRLAADKLATSLEEDSTKVKDLLSQNQVPGWAALLGKAGTANVTGSVNSFLQQIADLGFQRNIAVHKGDNAGAADLTKQIGDKRNAALAYTKSQLFFRDNPQYDDSVGGGDQAANRSILLGFQSTILDSQDRDQEQAKNATLAAQEKKLQADKAAAAAALAARKKAAEEQLKDFEEQNADWKAEEDRSLLEDAAWWRAKLDTLNKGSLNYRTISRKINTDIIAQNRELADAISRFTTDYQQDFDKSNGLSTSDQKSLDTQGKSAADYIKELRESIDLNKQNSDAIADAALRNAVATGQITRLNAATAQAAINTQTYTDALQHLKEQRSAITDDPKLDATARKAALQNNTNQTSVLNANRQIQVADDRQATNPQGTSAVVGVEDALDDFVRTVRDSASQMRQITESALGGINKNAVDGLFGQRTNFRGLGQDLAKQGTGVLLSKAEGSILGGLGFGSGKPSGTKDNPLYVSIVQGVTSGATGIATGFLGKLFGGKGSDNGGGDDSDDSSGSPVSGFLSQASHSIGSILSGFFKGGFASGGDIVPNGFALVGEHGPELVRSGRSGLNVTPNSALGGTQHVYNIDARGATDPSAVHAAVARAIPQAVAASSSVQHQRNLRRPQR